jgi:hypothetical protein
VLCGIRFLHILVVCCMLSVRGAPTCLRINTSCFWQRNLALFPDAYRLISLQNLSVKLPTKMMNRIKSPTRG